MIRIIHITIVFVLLLTFQLTAQVQKVSFSQYFNFPVLQNPAVVGSSDEPYRVAGIYRQQWRGIDAEFQTFGVSGDLKIVKNPFEKGDFGVGFYAIDDHLGNNIIKHQEVGISLAYHRPLDFQERHKLSIGFNIDYSSSAINYDPLIFENQYIGFIYDVDLPSGETFDNDQVQNINIGTGLNYQFQVNSTNKIIVGFSMLEILAPKQYFLSNEPPSRISNRWIGSSSLRHRLNRDFILVPTVQLISFQDATDFRMGTIAEFSGFKNANIQLDAGIFYQLKEAITFYSGVKYRNYSMHLSYDLTASPLNNLADVTEQNFKNPDAFEISFVMKGFDKSNKSKYTVPCRFF
jgi:type IX secretion system PorP/SprF family membrane protein